MKNDREENMVPSFIKLIHFHKIQIRLQYQLFNSSFEVFDSRILFRLQNHSRNIQSKYQITYSIVNETTCKTNIKQEVNQFLCTHTVRSCYRSTQASTFTHVQLLMDIFIVCTLKSQNLVRKISLCVVVCRSKEYLRSLQVFCLGLG